MATLTFPISRIEGHAGVEIEVQDGQVVSAHFKAMELRGFGYFVQGTPAEQMPVIVPRICGVCSTAHHVAAVKTLEHIYNVQPPPLARRIRSLLLLGQMIQNQATSVFIFTMPDRLGVSSIFQADGASTDEAQFKLAQRSLQVRKIGTDLISLAGGQFIHPVKAKVGGVTSGIAAADADAMRQRIQNMLPVACDLFEYYWESSLQMKERIGSWGDDTPAYYIASTDANCPDCNSSRIRIMAPDGSTAAEFDASEFRTYLQYQDTDYSYAGQTSFNGEILRANSLARLNMSTALGTPCADLYLSKLVSEFGRPAHPIMLFDLCRGIEMVYSMEKAIEILSTPIENEDAAVPYTPCDGEGYGLVEAPRGPLIHHYLVEKGKIVWAEFIIPTVHNMLAIEHALMVAARRYVTRGEVNLELENAVGRVVRAFDPCISCATH